VIVDVSTASAHAGAAASMAKAAVETIKAVIFFIMVLPSPV
jgi:hypothetical protein